MIDLALIHGLAIGFEFVEAFPEEDIPPTLIVDVLFLRIFIPLRR